MRVIGAVAHDRAFVAADQRVSWHGIVDVGRRRDHPADQPMRVINSHMRLEAETRPGLARALAKRRVRVRRRAVITRPCGRGLDHSGVQHRPAPQNQPGLIKLPVQLGKHLLKQPFGGQQVTEPAQRRVVRHSILQGEADKAPKRQPVRHRLLQLRVRETIKSLQQKRLEHQQRIVSRPAWASLAAHPSQELLETIPLDQHVQTIKPSVAAHPVRSQRINKTKLTRPLHRHRPVPNG